VEVGVASSCSSLEEIGGSGIEDGVVSLLDVAGDWGSIFGVVGVWVMVLPELLLGDRKSSFIADTWVKLLVLDILPRTPSSILSSGYCFL
jgi:hypothetical protein